MTQHPHGFEGLVQAISFTQNLVTRETGHSLVDAVFAKRDGQAIVTGLRDWLATDLADFVNEYATELTASIDKLIMTGNLPEADIVAAEALSELAGQLYFVLENEVQDDIECDEMAAGDFELLAEAA